MYASTMMSVVTRFSMLSCTDYMVHSETSTDVTESSGSNNTPIKRIEELEKFFGSLYDRTREEIKDTDPISVLQALVRLPMRLKNEYESAIFKILPSLKKAQSTADLFLYLGPFFSFIDYGLLEHIVVRFCSMKLQGEMKQYGNNVRLFMKETTVHQLLDYWPGQHHVPFEFAFVKKELGKNLNRYSLEELDAFRTRICSEIKLSELISITIGELTRTATSNSQDIPIEPDSAPELGMKLHIVCFVHVEI